jgi:hypothetical protein
MYSREDLISIVQRSVVPCNKWRDRDSACAQSNLNEIYMRLTAGVKYTYKIENDSIVFSFDPMTEEERNKALFLDIDSYEDYLNQREDSEEEMFAPVYFYPDEKYFGYMPTPERLEEVDGEDWY